MYPISDIFQNRSVMGAHREFAHGMEKRPDRPAERRGTASHRLSINIPCITCTEEFRGGLLKIDVGSARSLLGSLSYATLLLSWALPIESNRIGLVSGSIPQTGIHVAHSNQASLCKGRARSALTEPLPWLTILASE